MLNPVRITIGLGVVIVAVVAAYTYFADVWIPRNILMLAGLYLLLAPRIHEFLTDRAEQRRGA